MKQRIPVGYTSDTEFSDVQEWGWLNPAGGAFSNVADLAKVTWKRIIAFNYFTNRFHIALCLFINRSQKTSKCGKIITDTLGSTFLFLPHFDVICNLLLNKRTAINMESICFI